jgi:helix-turn-helix protein
VVREVLERTGINRTTAQRLTAPMRIGMRLARRRKAEALLRQGVTKAEVARSVGLSPSGISAMFKGQTFPTKKALSNGDGTAEQSRWSGAAQATHGAQLSAESRPETKRTLATAPRQGTDLVS